LYLGYVNAPTEGVIFGCILILLSAAYGPQIYHQPISVSFPSINWPAWMAPYSLQIVASSAAIGSAIFGLIPSSLWTVYRECRAKKRPFRKALRQLSFMFFVSSAAFAWLWSPHTHARQDHFILFHMSVGLAFGKMATKIILAHLTKQPFPSFSGLMMPLFIGAALFNALPMLFNIDRILLHQMETLYLYGFLTAAVVGYANWIYHVINSFCKFLDINCLTIKQKKQKVETTPYSDARLDDIRNTRRATSSPYRSQVRS
jgi:ethanolaminephosphotransferase